jgi:glycosyltransferase involved in cell wall biosynthesis
VVEAASKVRDQEFIFLFIGEGGKKAKLEKMVIDYGLTNVQFLPFQDHRMLPHSLSAADVAIVSLEEGINGLAMPSKLYTILASGTPVLAFCDPNSDIAEILDASHAGFVFRHDDIDRFVEKLNELKGDRLLLQKMKINARRYFEEHFTFERALVQYEKIMLSLKVGRR